MVSNILIKIQTVIIPPLVIISTGQEAYGTYVLLMAMMLQILAFNHFGLGFNYRRNLPNIDSLQTIRELFFPQFYLKVILVIIGSILTYFLIRFTLHNLNLDHRLFFLVPICLITTFLNSTFLDYLRYSRRTGWMSIIQSFSALLFLSVILIAYFLGQNLSAYKIILIETIVLAVPIFFICLIIYSEIGFGNNFYSKKEFQSDINFGLPEYGRNVLDMMSSTADRFLIAGFLGTATLSIYQPAMAIITVILLVPLTISLVTFPNLAKLLDEGKINRVIELIYESKVTILYFVLPWCFFCIFLGEDLFRIWLQDSIQLTSKDKLIFILGSFGVIFASLFQLNLVVLTGYKLTLKALKISITSFVVSILISAISIYVYREIFWAALGYLVYQLIAFIFSEKYIREQLVQKSMHKDFFKIFLASTISMLIIYNLYNFLLATDRFQSLFTLIISCIVGALSYLLITNAIGIQIILKSGKSKT